ncbi:FecCD family ABC transporter permease [Pseudothioclava arenosa]|uniref:ABC transporter permease n=1 Tax=Pseudothioclava arenosa TaxID=1795308 RepID=A0A2A4CQJ4_9RHOB|nr:iron ABC transporter permease [Pseudothioclava arenosa]PCD76875.1 ABC transporter permease [Pseudothioclava arenosa]
MTRCYSLILMALFAAVLVLFAGSLLVGPAAIGLGDSLAALFRGEGEMVTLVMREVRLPRAILGVLVGVALGLSGAAMQGLLRNPLAEPGLIGTSASAALGAVLALQTGLAAAFALALPLAALLGALISVLLILALAGPRGAIQTLILAGIGISALASALTSLVLNLSPNPFAASEIMFWMMGSLADRSMLHVGLAAPFILGGMLMMTRAWRGLDALTLGEDAAASMGVDLMRLRLWVVFATAAMVGAATAVAGAIGFVGLVVPHLLRRAVGASPARLLPASALGGAAVVLAADIVVRVIAPDRDLKLGVLTALVGSPFFLHLILRRRKDIA